MSNDILSKINFSPAQVQECFENNGFTFTDSNLSASGEVINYRFKVLKQLGDEYLILLYFFCLISYATNEKDQVLKIHSNQVYKSDRNLKTIADYLAKFQYLALEVKTEPLIYAIEFTYLDIDFILFDQLEKLDVAIKMVTRLTQACIFINNTENLSENEIYQIIKNSITNNT